MPGDLALSVIVPLHDTARLVEQLIRTASLTERRDIEYVFVDDASTDDTVAVVERLAPLLPAVQLIRRDELGSAYAARNIGLEASVAPAITFLDGDDWVARGYLDRALALWEQRDVDVMRFDYTRVTGTSREVKHMPIGVRGRPVLARDYVLPARRTTIADYPTAWGGIISRDFVDRHELRFDERFATAGDREWWWRVILADGRMSFEDLNGYFYRKGVARSLTTVGDERTLHYLGVLARVNELVRADRDAARLLPKVWSTVCSVVLFHLDHDERLSPDLRAEHERRVRALLSSAPLDALSAATVGMSTDALARLHGLGLPE
jgi:glycosyltransferase involved in cell wall biosynthesis